MRVKTLLALGILGIASTAFANFLPTTSTVVGATPNNGMDIVRLWIKNDGVGGTGTGITAVEITIQVNPENLPQYASNTLRLQMDQDVSDSGDGFPDANIAGLGGTAVFNWNLPTSNTKPTASAVRLGLDKPSDYQTWTLDGKTYTRFQGSTPAGFDQTTQIMNDSDPFKSFDPLNPYTVAPFDPTTQPGFQNVKMMRVTTATTSGPAAANTGNGYLCAVAIVPHGTPIAFFGSIAGDVGPIGTFTTVPEPGTFALLGIAGLALLGRRRRAA